MDFVAQGKELKSNASEGDSTICSSELENNLDICLELEPYQRGRQMIQELMITAWGFLKEIVTLEILPTCLCFDNGIQYAFSI